MPAAYWAITDKIPHGRPNEATEIFFFGIGDAYGGLANLIINKGGFHPPIQSNSKLTFASHEDRVYNRISGVVSVVGNNHLRPIYSHTQTWLSKWYKEVSNTYPAFLVIIDCS
jgi:histone deacetylase 6